MLYCKLQPDLRSAIDGGLVGARRLQDIVCAAINGNRALLLSSRGGVIRAIRLDDVVLDKRVARPSVERDVAVDALCVPGTGVGDVAGAAWVPALTSDKIINVVPLDAVLGGC